MHSPKAWLFPLARFSSGRCFRPLALSRMLGVLRSGTRLERFISSSPSNYSASISSSSDSEGKKINALSSGLDLTFQDQPSNVTIVAIENEVSRSYAEYALSVLLGRSIPDVRDGLKPVHRRILYSLYELKFNSNGPYRKCARVVGEVLGRFHPHGNEAVYDALVRLAQPFLSNVPLIQGHGNFGSPDGDAPAAMRYTECKLSYIAEYTLLDDLVSKTVDFIPNFDATTSEPLVLPARVPNVLINGSTGIAVGFTTSIPPHNIIEVNNALKLLLENPQATDQQLFQAIPAPDFPTGAYVLMQKSDENPNASTYRTGKGSFHLRAKSHIESVQKSGKNRPLIVFTELPYRVNKTKIVQDIISLANDRKISGITDVRDESDREGIRLVVEVKTNASVEVVMNSLFHATDLEKSHKVTLMALKNGKIPQVFSLREILENFIAFRVETITKRLKFQTENARARLHLLDALIICQENLNQLLPILTKAENSKHAKLSIQETFKFSETQADAVLSMPLRNLTNLEKQKCSDEHQSLTLFIEKLTKTLQTPRLINDIITEELDKAVNDTGGLKVHKRKSELLYVDKLKTDQEDTYDNEDMVVFFTKQGFVRSLPRKDLKIKQNMKLRARDFVSQIFDCKFLDQMLYIAQTGVVYSAPIWKIPKSTDLEGKAHHCSKLLGKIRSTDKIISVLSVRKEHFDESHFLMLITANGFLKKTSMNNFTEIIARGKQSIVLQDGDKVKWAGVTKAKDKMLLEFPERDLHKAMKDEEIKSQNTRALGVYCGVPGEVADCVLLPGQLSTSGKLVYCTAQGFIRIVPLSAVKFGKQEREDVSVSSLIDVGKGDKLIAIRACTMEDELFAVTKQGVVHRIKVKNVERSTAGYGAKMITLDEKDLIEEAYIVRASES